MRMIGRVQTVVWRRLAAAVVSASLVSLVQIASAAEPLKVAGLPVT
jgi:hypothetical protein